MDPVTDQAKGGERGMGGVQQGGELIRGDSLWISF